MTFPPLGWAEYQRHRSDIEAILDPRCYSLAWLDAALLQGAVKGFGADDGVILTEVRRYPAGASEVHGLVAAGNVGTIKKLIRQAEAWGREQGCIFAGISSRLAWGRVLKGEGYEAHQIALRKELA